VTTGRNPCRFTAHADVGEEASGQRDVPVPGLLKPVADVLARDVFGHDLDARRQIGHLPVLRQPTTQLLQCLVEEHPAMVDQMATLAPDHRPHHVTAPLDVPGTEALLVYPTCHVRDLDAQLTSAAERLLATMQREKRDSLSLCIAFYEEHHKQVFFSRATERVEWERWQLPVRLRRVPPEQALFVDTRAETAATVRRALFAVVQRVDANQRHVPPLTSKDVLPFPFKLFMPDTDDGGWGDTMWSLLKSVKPASFA
jgi:hypothetical protein